MLRSLFIIFVIVNTFALGMIGGVQVREVIKPSSGSAVSSFMTRLKKERKTVRTTAYCHLENEPGAVGNLNCLGEELRYYSEPRSAAADWSKYPVGTQFRIVGQPYLYEIDDYGSELVGKNTIDLYTPTLEMMDEWRAREVEIEIVKWGCWDRCIQVMEPRRKLYPHVAEMYGRIVGRR